MGVKAMCYTLTEFLALVKRGVIHIGDADEVVAKVALSLAEGKVYTILIDWDFYGDDCGCATVYDMNEDEYLNYCQNSGGQWVYFNAQD